MLEILLNRIQIIMNQSQSPTSPDSAPSLSKRRGKGTIGSQTHETGLVPAARTRQMQFLIKVQLRRTLIPLPAPWRRSHLCCAKVRGVSPKVSTELLAYIGGIESPLYSGNVSCQRGSARYDRWHRPQAATGAPRRRCGSCPTDCPADDGCPMRSSRSSPVRLPESASYR